MRQFRPVPAIAVLALILAGCAVKPLKAPCSRDEAPMRPMAYAGLRMGQLPAAEDDRCGPMRPVNALEPFARPNQTRPAPP